MHANATAVAWDAAASGWDAHRQAIRDWLTDATAALLDAAAVSAGDRVLDVAAGAGDQTIDIARRVGPDGAVLATDISPDILALARLRLHGAGLAQVQTRCADAQDLGLAGAGFDAAVSRLGLMFCADPLRAFGEIHAALRPGGRFAALVFDGPAHNPCITTMMQTALRHAGAAPRDPFQPGTLLSLGDADHVAALLSQAGFAAVAVRPLDAPWRAASAGDYVAFVRDAAPPLIEILKPLPAAARQAAWDDITQRLQRFRSADGWTGPNRLLLLSAVGSL